VEAPAPDYDLPAFVVGIDGSNQEVEVKTGYPGARVGYLTVASVLLNLARGKAEEQVDQGLLVRLEVIAVALEKSQARKKSNPFVAIDKRVVTHEQKRQRGRHGRHRFVEVAAKHAGPRRDKRGMQQLGIANPVRPAKPRKHPPMKLPALRFFDEFRLVDHDNARNTSS